MMGAKKKTLFLPRFKIAFSFTNEYRESIIRPVCEELLKMGYSRFDIFFDEWHPELLIGVNADVIAREIYQECSDYVVVLLSRNYSDKSWSANVEWYAIRSLINEGNRVCLLRINGDIASIDGLHSSRDIPFDIGDKSPSQIARFIARWHAAVRTNYPLSMKAASLNDRLRKPDNFFQNSDIFSFGHYPHKADGRETVPIEWNILKVIDNKALIISKYVLDAKPFHMEPTAVTWDACSLRRWLNETFLSSAFKIEERAQILEKEPHTNRDKPNSTERDIELTEKVFIIDNTEAEMLFPNNEARRCIATEYALARGARCKSYAERDSGNACRWLLRTREGDKAFSVDSDGRIDDEHPLPVSFILGVRPALWIKF